MNRRREIKERMKEEEMSGERREKRRRGRKKEGRKRRSRQGLRQAEEHVQSKFSEVMNQVEHESKEFGSDQLFYTFYLPFLCPFILNSRGRF